MLKNSSVVTNLKLGGISETVAVESRSSSGWTGGLCLPPPDTPAYTPTPIAVLKKRKSNEEAASAGQ